MPLSATIYSIDSGSAGQQDFDLIFEGAADNPPGYLKQTHIWWYLNGVQQDEAGGAGANGFTFTTETHVQLKDYSPVAGDEIAFRRIIPKEKPYVDFVDRAGITEKMLDDACLANLYSVHEIIDGYGTGISDSTEAAASYAALAEQWANEAEDVEVEAGKYSAKHYMFKAEDEKLAAETAKTGAETAQTAAVAAQTAAETAQTGAETAETNAATSEANINTTITTWQTTAHEWESRQHNKEESLTSVSGSVAWDLSAKPVSKITLSENCVFAAPTNLDAGAQYRLTIIQDATERTVSWNTAFKWENDLAPEIPAGSGDRLIIFFDDDGTNLWGQAFYSEA